MSASILTLAKKTKVVLANHAALVERDGTQEVPASFNFKFGGELLEAGDIVREHVRNITESLIDDLKTIPIPTNDDVSREAEKARVAFFAYRALFSIHNSPQGLLKTLYQVRTYGIDELSEVLPFTWDQVKVLDGVSGIYQFKRHDDNDNSPWTYSWIYVLDGKSISRGTKQPIHKLVAALLKCIEVPSAKATTAQLGIAELAKMKGASKPYYWYLSNKNTTMWYQAFAEHKSLTSCMSKNISEYSRVGRRQHPMDCYDESPDWSLMFISDKSPEELTTMCDLIIANPTEADTLFKFPWLSRCLVLPTQLETSRNTFETPYVMGKFYGEDKLIKMFYDNGSSGCYYKNNNELLSGAYYIEGGRIPAIASTKEGREDNLLLPYFDKANKARLIMENGKPFWVSVGEDQKKHRDPVAKCVYDAGVAKFDYVWSPANNELVSVDTYAPQTFTTIFGPELENFRDQYRAHTIEGMSPMLIPSNMFVRVEGQRVLRGAITRLYQGSERLTANVIANPERYLRIEGFGLFDMEVSAHKVVFDSITTTMADGEAHAES